MVKSFEDYPYYFYTGFFIRLFAFTVDLMMIGSLQRITLFFVGEGTLRTFLSLVIYLLYFILMTKLNKGQTIGKMIFGIKVIALNEAELSWATVLVREGFGRYIQKVVLVLYGLVIFTPYKQHVADLLTDTSVVTINYLRNFDVNQNTQRPSINHELAVE